MDWALVDAIAVVGLGVLFVIWADIMYAMTGSLYPNSIAIYLLIGGSFLTVGAGSLVALRAFRGAETGQTQLDAAAA
jgi:hypothetical protein